MARGEATGQTVGGWRERAAATKRRRSRQAILLAASTLFAEHGYGETSVEMIATTAAVGVGTIYNHFSGKPDIAASLWRPLYDRLEAGVDADIAAGRDPVEAVRRHLREVSQVATDNVALTWALVDALHESLETRTIDSIRARVPLPVLLQRLIDHGRASGSFRQGRPSAELASAIMTGHVLRIVNHPEQAPEDVAELFSAIVLGTVGAP